MPMQTLFAYFVISAFVALLDVLPLLWRHRPRAVCWALFLQCLFAGVVVFSLSLPGVPWWLEEALS